MDVSLREINAETVRSITELAVAPSQERFVAVNALSLAEALFSREAWFRAVYLAEQPVGFVMLYDESLRVSPPSKPQLAIWRFMIDLKYQRQGIGGEALRQVIEHARSKPALSSLLVSYVPGEGSPERFYKKHGFVPNGQIEEGEIVLELDLKRNET